MKKIKNNTTKLFVITIVLVSLVIGFLLLIRQNRINEDRKKDPKNILGLTIGNIYKEYCRKGISTTNKFYIAERQFYCSDIEQSFIETDFDNYILVEYTFSNYNGDGYFGFEVDNNQSDVRPMIIDNPEQFVGQMATSLCPRYSLADFSILATGENMGISTIPCKDINNYSMFRNVKIVDAYYAADEENGDTPGEYFEQNNANGTRRLIFDGEYI